MIRDECSNHQPDGSCLGMMINDDLSITRGHALPRCLIADNKRCPFFEECVAPMVRNVTDPRRNRALKEAVMIYQMQHKNAVTTGRRCPECGLPIEARQRLCRECADKRRKATYRSHKSKTRKQGGHMSTVNGKNDPKTPMKEGGNFGISQNAIEDSHPPQIGTLTVDIPQPGEAA
jgi:hypothetical protein